MSSLSLRSWRKHKAWGRQPQGKSVLVASPRERAKAPGRIGCRPFHGLQITVASFPGAHAQGFMLSPASPAGENGRRARRVTR